VLSACLIIVLVDKMSAAIYKPILWQVCEVLDRSPVIQYPAEIRDFYCLQNFETRSGASRS